MPGPQDPSDQAADAYGRGHDTPRPPDLSDAPADRPTRGSLTDLRQRLDRLPPGHPSSPYHDDGSRKPAVVRLKDLELPLPGDTGTAESEPHQPEADLAEADLAEPDRTRSDQDRAYGGRHAGAAQAGLAHGDDAKPDATDQIPGSPAETVADAALDPPQTRPDGSWEWKGRHLSASECKIADEMLSRCRAAEGRTVFGTYKDSGLTSAMRRVEAQLEHGQLVPETEKFALKSADRFKEKLAKLIADEPGAEPTELAGDIPDAIRYTYLFTEDGYSDGVWQVHAGLEEQGFELEIRRNNWQNDEYKGINSRWRDHASGQLFEVQFHTNLSWEAKQRTHDAYEGISSAATPTSEKEHLRAFQREVSASVPIPPGSLDIPNYRKGD